MRLDIRPTVDFAFKKLLGSPEHTTITVHFLNAVLECSPPIEHVEILNPILAAETDGDKLAILDVLAIDEAGRQFNIEMQTSLPAGLPQRLAYYASSLYVGQLGEGEPYTALRPAINICVLERPLLTSTQELHSDFRLRSLRGHVFTNDLQIHLVELSKSVAREDNIDQVSALERWSYFLSHADLYTAEDLRALLPETPFREAIGVLEMIARNPEQRLAYDARLKYLRDEAARMEFARSEGRQEGERLGLEKGVMIGKIRVIEDLLGLPISDDASYASLDATQLIPRLEELQRQLRERLS